MNFLSVIPETVSITDMQRRAPDVLRSLSRGRRTKVIMSRNKPTGVLMSPATYEAMTKELRHARELVEIRQIITEGDRDYKAGRTIEARSVSELMRKAKKAGIV